MNAKEAHAKWAYLDERLAWSKSNGYGFYTPMLHDLWQVVKAEAAPLNAERVQERLRELGEWFDGMSPGIVVKHHGVYISPFIFREFAAKLEYVMAEQRQAEKGGDGMKMCSDNGHGEIGHGDHYCPACLKIVALEETIDKQEGIITDLESDIEKLQSEQMSAE